MVRFIPLNAVLPLRNQVLRAGWGLTDDECQFQNDDAADTFHLGYYVNDQLTCVASFHKQQYEGFAGAGYQLRGMATLPQYQGKGYGNQLVNFAIVYLRGQQANYIWCNARKVAVRFYSNLGFEIISKEFDIPRIGPHYTMYLKVQ